MEQPLTKTSEFWLHANKCLVIDSLDNEVSACINSLVFLQVTNNDPMAIINPQILEEHFQQVCVGLSYFFVPSFKAKSDICDQCKVDLTIGDQVNARNGTSGQYQAEASSQVKLILFTNIRAFPCIN